MESARRSPPCHAPALRVARNPGPRGPYASSASGCIASSVSTRNIRINDPNDEGAYLPGGIRGARNEGTPPWADLPFDVLRLRKAPAPSHGDKDESKNLLIEHTAAPIPPGRGI